MPIALKLSKQFYEKFGEQVTNELVDAINVIDASHRSEFKELTAAIARLEAKVDERFATMEQRFVEQSRFMLLGWVTTIAAVIGTLALR